MEISDLMKNNPTNLNTMLSEILENSILNKSMLQAIIAEISNGNPEKENEILSIANDLKNKELLNVIARFTSENPD
jgi:Mg2+/Co2+ transporter CorC